MCQTQVRLLCSWWSGLVCEQVVVRQLKYRDRLSNRQSGRQAVMQVYQEGEAVLLCGSRVHSRTRMVIGVSKHAKDQFLRMLRLLVLAFYLIARFQWREESLVFAADVAAQVLRLQDW